MTTLEKLGLSRIGNYVRGEKTGIVLNKAGAKFFNKEFPSESNPNFSIGNHVELSGRMALNQGYNPPPIEAFIHGNRAGVFSLVRPETDDLFARI